MSFSSGTFSINSTGQPVVTGTVISSTVFNALTADLATGLSTCVLKDGTQTITANIPMATFKITGLGAATARADAASLANIQDGTGVYVSTVGGTADVITLTPSPAITAYAVGQTFRFASSGANTTNVTVNVSSLGAKAITKNGTTALSSGDIPSGVIVEITYDGTRFQLGQILTALGTAATVNTGTSDANVPLMSDLKPYLGKNIIIGGDFTTNPWQRGASFTALANGSYAADRFLVSHSSDAVVDILKTADAPTASEAGIYSAHCLHADVTTADAAIAAGQYYLINQKVEGLNAARFGFGQTGTRYVTLSFWVKSTKTGTFCVSFINSASNRSYVAEYTVSTTDTWEKKTVTVAVDTSGTWLYDIGIGLRVSWALAAGSTYQTTAGAWAAGEFYASANQVNALDNVANNFKLALVQLEMGQVATTFEQRSAAVESTLCDRYFRAHKTSPGVAISATGAQFSITHTAMRAAPTVSASAALTITDHVASNFTQSAADIGIAENNDSGGRYSANNFTGMTSGRFSSVITSGGAIYLSAEL